MMKQMDAKQIAKAIKNNEAKDKPVLIAIEGYGGSGKTTFANLLRGALGSAYVVILMILLSKRSSPNHLGKRVPLTESD